jgi:hypothetical protein
MRKSRPNVLATMAPGYHSPSPGGGRPDLHHRGHGGGRRAQSKDGFRIRIQALPSSATSSVLRALRGSTLANFGFWWNLPGFFFNVLP